MDFNEVYTFISVVAASTKQSHPCREHADKRSTRPHTYSTYIYTLQYIHARARLHKDMCTNTLTCHEARPTSAILGGSDNVARNHFTKQKQPHPHTHKAKPEIQYINKNILWLGPSRAQTHSSKRSHFRRGKIIRSLTDACHQHELLTSELWGQHSETRSRQIPLRSVPTHTHTYSRRPWRLPFCNTFSVFVTSL